MEKNHINILKSKQRRGEISWINVSKVNINCMFWIYTSIHSDILYTYIRQKIMYLKAPKKRTFVRKSVPT